MKHWFSKSAWLLAGSLLCVPGAMANEFSASFKGTDIQEFINIVGRNLEKTIIVDPSVRGKIDVRSYDVLNEEQYYSFFLNVLEVYGYAVVEMDNGVLKVIKAKDSKTSAIPVMGDGSAKGDSVITRVVAVRNVSVRELSPLLRQLIDNAGAGNVVHYDPANIILITGRAAVVNRLAEIIKRVDQAGDKEIELVELRNASAAEMVRIVEALNKTTNQKSTPEFLEPKIVADERTNSILISGDPKVRARLKRLIRQLDVEMATKGNNRVVYLKYAKAEDLVDVLKGVSDNLQAEKQAGQKGASSAQRGDVVIAAHEATNSLVLTAPPDIMMALQDVISQLDIRRAQVLIEALIVEMSEGDGINLGVQWGSLETGAVIQYGNAGAPIGQVMVGLEEAKDTVEKKPIRDSDTGAIKYYEETTTKGDYSTLASALKNVNGAAMSIVMGDWTALVSAVASDSNSNILSSPSITVMDNGEASFIVGEEVPVITGSTAGSNNDNPFQTVDRKEVGIKLKVVPQINEGDSVQLNIEQEVSNVLGANGAVDVRFAKRQLNTSVMIQDGQMLVLGGLVDERALESESKVPLLGDIPVLGHLFKSTSTQTQKRNLMVFIKPTIIRDGMTADGITQRKYNFIRAEQLYKADQGLKLMSDDKIPVMPAFGQDRKHPAEIQAFIDQMEKN
ncbi:type II secretion system secretin GspD [Vibrio parahaemolyticus]|uniref:Type II secretion system secretin GspD n=9 Tax=Vibrio parahaemolyticus TaxID=670 RepID=A0A0M0DEB1_VIBPH|nr:type II secretion system secretin GspD [Vibrio parahaemolyticus]EFO38228.1 general secretion pathway protein D [Vibrio parahaemolyticus Peru-466]EFO47234.1 general secretion pathway protein D [Vibrio parahaemolyticus AQ4037]EFO50967.1 general secretion pathway protein D [Vibrio parahaemolyticus K5030]EJG0872121.1 type II secretion system secretin GspD [Vibrio parahaemolyticus O3]EJG0900780.1 type II secretion system secretin GspD [Vibrio parahaemolyticus O3:K56]EJG0950893.1 type II secreti